jgi:hypothetical protein
VAWKDAQVDGRGCCLDCIGSWPISVRWLRSVRLFLELALELAPDLAGYAGRRAPVEGRGTLGGFILSRGSISSRREKESPESDWA